MGVSKKLFESHFNLELRWLEFYFKNLNGFFDKNFKNVNKFFNGFFKFKIKKTVKNIKKVIKNLINNFN
jgi:hypothetical protein